jgi:hypothetical protein
MARITGQDIQRMVRHWLKTPTNGYLGSDYGQDAKSLLQRPHADGLADAFLQKLRTDVPIVGAMPSEDVNLYAINTPPDKTEIVIEVAGTGIEVGS